MVDFNKAREESYEPEIIEQGLEVAGSNQFQDMLARMREQQDVLDAASETPGYPAAYMKGLHPNNELSFQHGAATLEIKYASDDAIYGKVAAVLPIEVIGTVSEKSAANPPQRRWETKFTDEAAQAEFGPSICMSSGNFTPDPAYDRRVLTHPDAQSPVLTVSAGFNSQKTKEIPTSQMIVAVVKEDEQIEPTDCRECVFGSPQFYSDGALALQQVCRPKFSGVFNLIGLSGVGLLETEQRGVAVVNMVKQAARTMFARKKKKGGSPNNDTIFQDAVDIPAPMEVTIKNKGLGGLDANMVMFPRGKGVFQLFTFPLLLGTKQFQNTTKQGKKLGISIIPILFNPADSIRRFIADNADVDNLYNKALFQATADFSRYMDVKENQQQFAQEIMELLDATVSIEGTETEFLMFEHTDVRGKYLKKNENDMFEGRVKLTTPFQAAAKTEDEEEAKESTTPVVVAPTVKEPIVVTEEEEELLEKLNEDKPFNFESFESFEKDWGKK